MKSDVIRVRDMSSLSIQKSLSITLHYTNEYRLLFEWLPTTLFHKVVITHKSQVREAIRRSESNRIVSRCRHLWRDERSGAQRKWFGRWAIGERLSSFASRSESRTRWTCARARPNSRISKTSSAHYVVERSVEWSLAAPYATVLYNGPIIFSARECQNSRRLVSAVHLFCCAVLYRSVFGIQLHYELPSSSQ